ncbi:MAG TPA: hypothetical protein VLL52_11665, partial [Anaerolineae bacterium]|nr:hypothetical protein [Anaerolineae bacterium]
MRNKWQPKLEGSNGRFLGQIAGGRQGLRRSPQIDLIDKGRGAILAASGGGLSRYDLSTGQKVWEGKMHQIGRELVSWADGDGGRKEWSLKLHVGGVVVG